MFATEADPAILIVLCVKSIDQNPYKNKRHHNESTANENKQAKAEIQQKISEYQKIQFCVSNAYIFYTVNQAQLVEFLCAINFVSSLHYIMHFNGSNSLDVGLYIRQRVMGFG